MSGQWNGAAAGQAVGEVECCSWIAGPEGVVAAADFCACTCHLGNRVHWEGGGRVEPQLVARALEGRQERVPVACGPVEKVCSFGQRAGSPGELATRAQQAPVLVVVGRKASERCDDTGRAVTP